VPPATGASIPTCRTSRARRSSTTNTRALRCVTFPCRPVACSFRGSSGTRSSRSSGPVRQGTETTTLPRGCPSLR
jgi:hypothetical protein